MGNVKSLGKHALLVTVLLLTLPAVALACARYVSCTSPENMCMGELVDGIRVEFDGNLLCWGPICLSNSGPNSFDFPEFCSEFCTYRMTGSENETYTLHMLDLTCNGQSDLGWVSMVDDEGLPFQAGVALSHCGIPTQATA
ncbi:MAG: hypothetical protein EA422_16095 [Gemmatimonadales bacterium]|nr:MAG: hypothetical protein EA422_16095 [Gemmatimonadales bacterium]